MTNPGDAGGMALRFGNPWITNSWASPVTDIMNGWSTAYTSCCTGSIEYPLMDWPDQAVDNTTRNTNPAIAQALAQQATTE